MDELGGQVGDLEEEVEDGETLEQLLERAIGSMRQLWLVVVVAVVVAGGAFTGVVGAIYYVWQDNQKENASIALESCHQNNSRAHDLVGLTEKVQEIVGGPGVSDDVDALAEFGRAQFVQRDCDGDGEITDADRALAAD